MRKIILTLGGAVLLGLIAIVGALAWSYSPASLDASDTTRYPRTPFEPGLAPDATALPDFRISILNTGMIFARKLMAYRGGSIREPFVAGATAVLVRHPRGDFLFDAGYGRNIDAHRLASMPVPMRIITSFKKERAASDQLAARNVTIDRFFLSHSHWDHVSGIEDFLPAEVWMSVSERAFIDTGGKQVKMLRDFGDAVTLKTYEFTSGAYRGFEKSFDLFGDNGVVIVPLPGHTPGSVGMFVNLRSGKRFFFVGDAAWVKEAVALPAERPWLQRMLVDSNLEAVRRSVVAVHRLSRAMPELIIVPSHDRTVTDGIAEFPAYED